MDIKVSILPPYPSKVTDYASHPQQVVILLRSLSNIAQDIQLRGSITGDNGVVLSVDPHYRSPAPIHLNGGQALNLNASDISQLFDYNTLVYSGISKQTVILGNGLPEGNYQVCVQAYNYVNNQPLSSAQPLGCSNTFPITSVEPPVIISPFDDQPVSALTTQNFVISWTTPAGAPPSRTIHREHGRDPRQPQSQRCDPFCDDPLVLSADGECGQSVALWPCHALAHAGEALCPARRGEGSLQFGDFS